MKSLLPLFLCLFAVLLGSGCIAFDVGDPTISECFEQDANASEGIVYRSLENVVPTVKAESDWRGARVTIGLDGTFLETRRSVRRSRRVRVEEQRKMSFGLFPVWAEWIWRPEGGEEPKWKPPETGFEDGKPPCAPVIGIMSYAVGVPLATGIASVAVPYTTLVVPFAGDYEGVTLEDSPYPMVPFGFHRYHTSKTTVLSTDGTEEGSPTTSRATKHAVGPFDVTLNVPDLAFRETKVVPVDGSWVAFSVPAGAGISEVDAEIRIERKNYAGGAFSFRKDNVEILKAASGRTFRRRLRLARESRGPSGGWTGGGTVVTNVIVIENPSPRTKAYDIMTEKPYENGQAAYRVQVHDDSLSRIDAAKRARPEIERILRDAFLSMTPGADESKVRVHAVPDFDVDGPSFRMLGYVAYLKPTVIDWSYDPDTMIGTIRILVPSGMDVVETKKWARDNIGAIVEDKGLSIEVGKDPPPGATYELETDKKQENGILTLSFHVIN